MDRRNLLIAGSLVCGIIILVVIGVFIIIPAIGDTSTAVSNSIIDKTGKLINESAGISTFDNSTSKSTAISVARLNQGMYGFDGSFSNKIINASLTSDGKYWIVEYTSAYPNESSVVTINAKTWASKMDNGEWKSLDELKASYMAEIQSVYTVIIQSRGTAYLERPYKVTTEGKKVWKVPVMYTNDEDQEFLSYVYVDVATGKSKNTWDEFNKFAGTDGWLTLKQVDNTINKIQKETDASFGIPTLTSFRDALRDLYSE
ncbi:hypothetical protein [Methanobacterium sp. MBAC-LM]|uniref:hypothetical protein n=1 Tax=Methanobacterium sp. MBAC-LM TaxID=3412034 RepID=UPI003C76F49B